MLDSATFTASFEQVCFSSIFVSIGSSEAVVKIKKIDKSNTG